MPGGDPPRRAAARSNKRGRLSQGPNAK